MAKGPFAAREGGELRSQFCREPERWREGMLRGAAPVNGRTARSTAARVETVSAKEPGSSQAESEAGIRAEQDPTRDPVKVGSRSSQLSHTQNE